MLGIMGCISTIPNSSTPCGHCRESIFTTLKLICIMFARFREDRAIVGCWHRSILENEIAKGLTKAKDAA